MSVRDASRRFPVRRLSLLLLATVLLVGCGLAKTELRMLLSDYRQPDLDPSVAEALDAFIARRKSEMPDAFA